MRSAVRFLQLNLNENSYDLRGEFDLIFCRNVLIYFDREVRQRIVRCLLSHLSPSCYLFVGHGRRRR